MSGHLPSLVLLHKTHNELVETRERLAGVPDWMRELHDEHSSRKAEIDAVAAHRDEAAKTRRNAEAALSDAQEKAKHFQAQSGQVSTQREYTAVLKEIDTVKAQINELEKQVLDLIEQHDEADKELEKLNDDFRDLDERYEAELAKWEAEKPGIAHRGEVLGRELDELRQKLARPFLALYDRIYERHGTTSLSRIVRVQTIKGGNAMWHCEACSFNVRPQILVEIRNDGAIIQCDSCKRILYLEDDEEA